MGQGRMYRSKETPTRSDLSGSETRGERSRSCRLRETSRNEHRGSILDFGRTGECLCATVDCVSVRLSFALYDIPIEVGSSNS